MVWKIGAKYKGGIIKYLVITKVYVFKNCKNHSLNKIVTLKKMSMSTLYIMFIILCIDYRKLVIIGIGSVFGGAYIAL